MSNTRHLQTAPRPQVNIDGATLIEHKALARWVDANTAAIQAVHEQVVEQAKTIEALTERVAALEAQPAAETVVTVKSSRITADEAERVDALIRDFLTRHAGVRFTAVSVARNVGIDNRLVARRLRTLDVECERAEGASAVYWVTA